MDQERKWRYLQGEEKKERENEKLVGVMSVSSSALLKVGWFGMG